ncbi:hypothetical protein Vafri_9324, partial [Volvox africanus]
QTSQHWASCWVAGRVAAGRVAAGDLAGEAVAQPMLAGVHGDVVGPAAADVGGCPRDDGIAAAVAVIVVSYLEGCPFVVKTDHKPLTFLQGDLLLNRHQAHWLEFLARFKYTWEDCAGSLE